MLQGAKGSHCSVADFLSRSGASGSRSRNIHQFVLVGKERRKGRKESRPFFRMDLIPCKRRKKVYKQINTQQAADT